MNDNIFESSPETISIDEIINFAYMYDDKKHTLKELEDKIIQQLQFSNDIVKLKTFYLNHLDLFVKHQNKFQKVIRYHLFLDDYMKYRTTFADIKTFLDSLTLHYTLTSTPSTPSTPSTLSPSTPSSSISTSSKSSIKSKLIGLFEKSYPILSIFHKITPEDFSIKCHRMYLCYYFMTEMREYQFYSRVSNRELSNYAEEFSNFYNNLYRKLEQEIDIFCEANQFSSLTDIFITLTKYFLEVGNTPLAQITINLIERFKICKHKKIQQFFESYNISNNNSLKQYKQFSYLVDPGSINKAFITAQETDNKIKTFSFIQKKMITTRDEILTKDIMSVKPNYDDFILFNYINPKITIKEKLYTSSTPGGMEYLCIENKCKSPQNGSGFNTKHTKYPRKWSKEYCTHTSCNKMGFSQKASCRYYKNCYK